MAHSSGGTHSKLERARQGKERGVATEGRDVGWAQDGVRGGEGGSSMAQQGAEDIFEIEKGRHGEVAALLG
jgi:hypothetical protein